MKEMWILSSPKTKTNSLELQLQIKRSRKTFCLFIRWDNIGKFYCCIKESGVSLFAFFTQSNPDQVIELKSEYRNNHNFDHQQHQFCFVSEIFQIESGQ